MSILNFISFISLTIACFFLTKLYGIFSFVGLYCKVSYNYNAKVAIYEVLWIVEGKVYLILRKVKRSLLVYFKNRSLIFVKKRKVGFVIELQLS